MEQSMNCLGRFIFRVSKNEICCRYLVSKLYPPLSQPHELSLLSSSVHGIFQARILEWVAISSSRGFSQPRNWTWVSCASLELQADCFTTELYFSKTTSTSVISSMSSATEVLQRHTDLVTSFALFDKCCQIAFLWSDCSEGGGQNHGPP